MSGLDASGQNPFAAAAVMMQLFTLLSDSRLHVLVCYIRQNRPLGCQESVCLTYENSVQIRKSRVTACRSLTPMLSVVSDRSVKHRVTSIDI